MFEAKIFLECRKIGELNLGNPIFFHYEMCVCVCASMLVDICSSKKLFEF